jgi:hypothetical protein
MEEFGSTTSTTDPFVQITEVMRIRITTGTSGLKLASYKGNLPLDAGHVNDNIDVALPLHVAHIRLLDGHGPLEKILATEIQKQS